MNAIIEQIIDRICEEKKVEISGDDAYSVGWNSACNTIPEYLKEDITREGLMQICKDAVVPFKKWNDRDSYRAQCTISDIHGLLSVGAEYELDLKDPDTTWILFKNLTSEQENNYDRYLLPTDSLDDYFKEFDGEMFDGGGIDVGTDYMKGYMPTRRRLSEVKGEDWYE